MKKILLCGAVHEKKEIFELHLESVRNLEIPIRVEVDSLYILHNCEHLKDLFTKESYMIYKNETVYHKDDNTHHWEFKNFSDVVNMKNILINVMLKNDYDYIFFIDSDIILHPKSLQSLLSADKDMIANIFWTKWKPDDEPNPNAWDFDNYLFKEGSIEQWKQQGYYQVGMTGACTLIKRKVLESGVNWNPIYNISYSYWEDRAFCIKTAVNGFEIWIDTHYPATHLYRETELQDYLRIRGANNE